MPRIGEKIRKVAWFVSGPIAAAMIVFGSLNAKGTPLFDEFIFFAIIIAITPPTVLDYIDYKWRRSIDERLPDLFRSIVQAQEIGMTLTQALEEVAKRDYGPLTAELRKMTTQISWGMPLEEALMAFLRRVNTPFVRRTVPLIIEANRSGGHVEMIFDPLSKFVQSILILKKEHQTRTRPYIAVIYVAFFVFIFTIILLFKSFFIDTQHLPLLGATIMTAGEVKRLFFDMIVIQAFFGGLIAGKMGEGTINAGLKHSLVLMIFGYIAIKLFL
jgi:flagellar protein FlaJ